MVNLESYDSEGPHTPETDDSAEVSVLVYHLYFVLLLTYESKVCDSSKEGKNRTRYVI